MNWKSILLCFFALNSLSCSTPPVPERDTEDFSSTWDAYQSCVQQLTPYGRSRECDQMQSSGGRGLSYSEYYGVNYDYSRNSDTQSSSLDYAQDPYFGYLASLSPDVREEMRLQWENLAKAVDSESNLDLRQQTPWVSK